ncbi:putative T7SS-secreted protein [Streptomyces sp. NPDC058646]|uniref:putative T7SS-secreted protein n=1 Tax=Streptomyces sp. NPDC058646 TaxID=3346574 RepID=UPI00365297A1
MVDFGGLVDKGLGKLEEGVDAGKRIVGEGIDKATDVVGDGLEYVGAEDWADSVEDWGDRTASSLGAKVGEQQLGQTEEANELIHGKVADIDASVKNLRDFKSAFDSVGQGMKALDSSRWKGEAANAFREKFQTLPTDWLHAADAFEAAATALATYATTVTWAQGKAKEAIALYKKGQEASKAAVDAYNQKVDAYNEARTGDKPLPKPDPFTDPGKAGRDRAQEVLEDARRQRNEAADTAAKAVAAALAHAPEMPSATDRAKFNLADWGVGQGVEMLHFGGGVVKGVVGITNFVRAVNPLDLYNITHPAEYYKNINMTLAGLASTAAHPDRALKNAWDAAKGDPSEFLGRLVPEIIGTKGAGVIRGGIRAGMKNGLKQGLDGETPGPARSGVENPANPSRTERAAENDPSDPIDLATGAMYLPQTDITLPGTLPLVFRRRVASDYRAGRWFGPSWSSTADQRLEIDSEGVVFVSDDGLLLCYPHPAPGVPVLPSHGPRWPLDRDRHGDYTITDPDTGRVRHFETRHPNEALLTQIDDRNGNWISFEYDHAGTPNAIIHHGGYHLKLTTRQGRITSLQLAAAAPDGSDQEIRRYSYTDGHLTEVFNSSGLPLRFTYDERGRVTSWTDTNDSRYEYAYDDYDRCVAEGGAEGHASLRIDYDAIDIETGLRVTTAISGTGAVHQYVVNDACQIIKEIDPLGSVTHFNRDRYNRILSRTDPLGHDARFQYDDRGRLTALTRPDGRKASAEYNDLGLQTRITNPDRTTVHHTYDERGNRTSVTAPTGAVTRFTFNEAGQLTTVTDALGHTTRLEHNQAGLVIRVTNPLGAIRHIERDVYGRPVGLTDPLGNVTRFAWTQEGQLARRVEADGTEQSWTYDGEGNCLTHTDAMGGVSHFEYTHFDLLAARIGPDGARYEFSHDHELRLVQVRNPLGETWDYKYNAAGYLVAETDFDNRRVVYERDAAGRLTARTDELGRTIRYERDAMDRIVVKDSAGVATTYAYDLSDRLAVAVSPDSKLTRLRDQYGRLISETVDNHRLSYQYDPLGRRVSRKTPGGAVSTYSYDAAGQRESLTACGHVLTFEHDMAGQETTRRIGDAVSLAFQFDQLGRMTGQHVTAQDRDIQHRGYQYRADGHLVGLQESADGDGGSARYRSFELDAVGRVTEVRATDWAERYAYDAAGNQTQASWPTSHPGQEATGRRAYQGSAITRAGSIRYEHDALGRITLRQKTRLSRKPDTWRYEWDADDRLAAITTPDGARWRYRYDPLGRRIAKERISDDGENVLEEVRFTWDGATLCEQTTSDVRTTALTLTWEHEGLRPITQFERIRANEAAQDVIDERFFGIITDLIGAPTELIDEHGSLAWQTRSSLWGITAWNANATAYTPLRFPGQYFDHETGLHYNFHRIYDPETARYLSSDPLGLIPDPNPTAYVSNPHTVSDALGLAPELCPYRVERVPDEELGSLYHYTNGDGYDGMLESQEMWPSIKEHNPKDARFGDGQYLSDIQPGTKRPGQLSHAFLRVPWSGNKFTHFFEIDVRGLEVMRSVERPDVYVILNDGNLDLSGRIINHGKN